MSDLPTEEMIEAGAAFAKNYETYNAEGWEEYVRDLYLAMRAVEPDGWQPIETAPKDGTDVLVWADGGQYVAAWCQYFTAFKIAPTAEYDNDPYVSATHWRPLPPSPEGV
jgi:hypothetical protein